MNLLTVKKLRQERTRNKTAKPSNSHPNYEKIARLHEAKNIQSGHYDHSN